MEGLCNQDIPLELVPYNSHATDDNVHHLTEESPNPHLGFAVGRDGSLWTCLPKSSHSYVEYLNETSASLPKAAAEVMLGGKCLQVDSSVAVDEMNEMPRSIFYDEPRKFFGSRSDSSNSMDFQKQVRFWRPNNEGELANKFARTQQQMQAKNKALSTLESRKHTYGVPRIDSRAKVASPILSPKSRKKLSRQKSTSCDRQRRERIAEKINALQELLPTTAEGAQANTLDDIIDHIKYLQLQIKELSQSRLGGESSCVPLISREGYGHYINEQMLNEPLEEVIGKLLEEQPVEAAQLLERKGLFLLPMSLVEDLYAKAL